VRLPSKTAIVIADASITTEISDRTRLPEAPLVSVTMLAYRHEQFIAQAIESVVGQQCDFPFELIIGEDCSPDRTREIVLDYQRRYPHLIRVLISDRNVGMQANAARCGAASRGKYGAACEGDDYWCDTTKLARQVALFEQQSDCVLVFHAAKTIDVETGREGITGRRSPYSRLMRTEEIILGDGGFIPTASIMLKGVPGLSPDWVTNAVVPDYAIQLCAASLGRVAYIDRAMSVWRINVPHSWSKRYTAEFSHRFEHARQIERMFDGFTAMNANHYRAAAARMVSKYYSDAIVRFPGNRNEKRESYEQVSGKLIGSDRLLAWLAANWGLRLPHLKTFIRKVHTLLRLAYSLLTTQRIRDAVPVRSGRLGNTQSGGNPRA
jgi:glycosyltransferase involved in cell wall biosynthesis